MQACKDECLVMLRTKKVIQDLNISNPDPQYLYNQLTLIEQLIRDVSAAVMKIAATRAEACTLAPQHTQLLKCFASLVSTLVGKLTLAEEVSESRSQYTDNGSDTTNATQPGSTSSSLLYQTFSKLFCLLYVTCTSYLNWDCAWAEKDPCEYEFIRTAFHNLMSFFLHSTRRQSQIWCIMVSSWSPKQWHYQAFSILSGPVLYLQSITKWPACRITREIEAMPPQFVSLLCCLTLEQLDSCPQRAGATVAGAVTAKVTDEVWEDAGMPRPILTLGVTLNRLLSQGWESLKTEIYFAVLSTPAVIHLYKRIFIVDAEQRGPESVPLAIETLAFLANFLEHGNRVNTIAAGHPSMQAFMQACACSPIPLLPLYRPAVAGSSDTQLLRSLLKYVPDVDKHIEWQYRIIRAVTLGWCGPTDAYLPFPPPSVEEQLRGLYIVAHHCSHQTTEWMRQQRQQDSAETSSTFSQKALAPIVQQLVTVLCRNTTLEASLRELLHTHENSELHSCVQLKPAWDPILLHLRNFYLMPGSVAMLEASLRDAFRSQNATKVFDTIMLVTSVLPRSFQSTNDDTLLACVSLSSTLLKLLFVLMDQCSPDNEQQLQQQQQQNKNNEKEGDTSLAQVLYLRIPDLMLCSQNIMMQLDACTAVHTHQPDIQQNLSQQNEPGQFIPRSLSRSRNIHQMSSVLLCSWTQMYTFMSTFQTLSKPDEGSPAEEHWQQWIMQVWDKNGHEAQNTVVSSVLHGLLDIEGSPAVNQHPPSSIWEHYAVKHLCGRLLVGCCHLGCTNLSGVSEASVKTLLCGGCRKARYCCVLCQRAAWVAGAHNTLCLVDSQAPM